MSDIERYPWLTVESDGRMIGVMEGTTPAEMDRRLIIMQEIKAGRLVLAHDHQGAVRERDTFARALRLAVASPALREAYVRQAESALARIDGGQ